MEKYMSLPYGRAYTIKGKEKARKYKNIQVDKQRLSYLFTRYLQRQCSPGEVAELLDYFGQDDTTELTLLIRAELEREAIEPEETSEQTLMFERMGNKINQSIDQQEAAISRLGKRKLLTYMSIAAMLTLLLTGYLIRLQLLNFFDPVKTTELATLKGERKQIRLADGTVIWLSPDSKLSYPDKFRGDTREVSVSGEAFLEVAHDAAHPFIVHTGKINTRVLGTSFDVKAYPADGLQEVVLLTGKVEVTHDNSKAIMAPNQRVTFRLADNSLVKEDYPDAALLLDRKDGNLIYKRTLLPVVIKDLERAYSITIRLDKRMINCRFSGKFKAGEKPESILLQLTSVFNASCKKTGTNNYTITGKSCN